MLDKVTLPGTDHRSEHLFVMRIWREPGRLGHDCWRGSIEHVPSGQRFYFTINDRQSDIYVAELHGLR